MKKRLFSLVLALVLCFGLASPVKAYQQGVSGENNTIAAGGRHRGVIDVNHSLWMWGENYWGQLGTGKITMETEDRPIKVMDDVRSVFIEYDSTMVIKTDNSLWVWGDNQSGQLGTGTQEMQVIPTKIMDDVSTVSLGHFHAAAVKTDGSLWVWGENNDGSLGNGDRTWGYSLSPAKVMDGVIAVSCGESHTAAIKQDNSLWIWGNNSEGVYGNGTQYEVSTYPLKIMDNVKDVNCGPGFTVVLKTDGSVWAWGNNMNDNLGLGEYSTNNLMDYFKLTPQKVMDGVAKIRFKSAIKTDGTLWIWGTRTGAINGVILEGIGSDFKTPTKVMDNVADYDDFFGTSMVLRTDGSIYLWGQASNSSRTVFMLGKDMEGILIRGKYRTVPAGYRGYDIYYQAYPVKVMENAALP